MARRVRKQHNRRRIIPLWTIPSLVLAAGMIGAAKLGYGEQVEQAVAAIGTNTGFVEAAVSAELGTLASAAEHAPGSVGADVLASTEQLPDALTEEESECDTNAERALVSESLFRPPKEVQRAVSDEPAPTETADGGSNVTTMPTRQRLNTSIATVKYGRPIGWRSRSSTTIRSMTV